jgi:hypothetical protein
MLKPGLEEIVKTVVNYELTRWTENAKGATITSLPTAIDEDGDWPRKSRDKPLALGLNPPTIPPTPAPSGPNPWGANEQPSQPHANQPQKPDDVW